MNRKIDGYLQKQEMYLKEVGGVGTLWEHEKTGARVLTIENKDKNKVFQIGFRTPVENSTGIAHIMEHSVLCGSKNYPVKDPFVELVKGSLNTFLNAMTYPDKTVYPVASCHDKDFENLMLVYLDAVFYPKIYQHPEIFWQEGWSYKLEQPEDALEYNGVVYNEMKGAFSSPEGVLDRVIQNTLFPDTSYANESGGAPEEIPNLTYEAFLDFHRTYYHPSNSFIYLYGDVDVEGRLKLIDEKYLQHFDRKEIDSRIHLQKAFEEVKEKELYYSITEEESEEDNTYLSYNKVIGTSLDRELYLAFQILEYVLLSAPSAILRKALLEKRIGKDIMGSYENGILQPMFSVIAKHANPEDKIPFIQAIEDALKKLVAEGIDKRTLEAAINYHEFRYREGDFGGYPRGLMYGLQIMDSWLYDENQPFLHLEAEELFTAFRERVGSSYFEDLIQSYLLDNPHGAIVTVLPEKGMTMRLERELAQKLEAYKNRCSKEELEAFVLQTKALRVYQDAPEKEEDVLKIPVLDRRDISKEIESIQNEPLTLSKIPVMFHSIETKGIGYTDFLFSYEGIKEELLPYVGILQGILGLVDTKNYGYGEFFDELNVHTGGIETGLELYINPEERKEGNYRATFEVRVKAFYSKLPIAYSMVEEMILRTKLEDEERLKELLSMIKSRLLMKFQSAGHLTAASRALSYQSEWNQHKQLTKGIDFYQLVKRMEENFEEEKEDLKEKLSFLMKTIFVQNNLMVSYTGEKESLPVVETSLENMSKNMPIGTPLKEKEKLRCVHKNEGYKTASKVQYVAQAGNFLDKGYPYHGSLQILKVILSYEYLWQKVRVRGGAYGCMSGFNRLGEGYFVSYRDPNLKQTLKVYQGVVEFLRNFQVGERDMTKYIIGTISNFDHPMTPSAKGERSMALYLNGITEEMLIKERKEILEASEKEIQQLAPLLESILSQNQICVVGSEEKIEEEKEVFDVITGF